MDDFFSVGFRYEGLTFIKRVRPETYFMYTYAISKKENNCLFTLNKQIVGNQTRRKSIRSRYSLDFDNLNIWTSNVNPGLIWSLTTRKDDCYLSRSRNILEFKTANQDSPTKIELYPNPIEERKKKIEIIIKKFIEHLIQVNNSLLLQIKNKTLFIQQLTDYARDEYSLFVENELSTKREVEILNKLKKNEAEDCKIYFQNFIQSEKSASFLKSLISPDYVSTMYPEMKEKGIDNKVIQETIDLVIEENYLFPSVLDTEELLADEVRDILMYDPVQDNKTVDIDKYLLQQEEEAKERRKRDEQERKRFLKKFGLNPEKPCSFILDFSPQMIEHFESTPQSEIKKDLSFEMYTELWDTFKYLAYTKRGKLIPSIEKIPNIIKKYQEMIDTLCSLNILQKGESGYQFYSFEKINDFAEILKEVR